MLSEVLEDNISQDIEVFTVIAVTTSDPTNSN
jgi:hypothetical protein